MTSEPFPSVVNFFDIISLGSLWAANQHILQCHETQVGDGELSRCYQSHGGRKLPLWNSRHMVHLGEREREGEGEIKERERKGGKEGGGGREEGKQKSRVEPQLKTVHTMYCLSDKSMCIFSCVY